MNHAKIISKQFKALGTDVDVRLVVVLKEEVAKAESDLADVQGKYTDFEKRFSRFNGSSELSGLNCNLNVYLDASDEMLEMASKALLYHVQSGGFFDPRMVSFLENVGYNKDFHATDFFSGKKYVKNEPNTSKLQDDLKIRGKKIMLRERMDFSGLAKGYITDKIVNFLIARGWKNFLVDSGGDMYLKGIDEKGQVWKIGVEGIPESKILFSLSDKAVATSGTSRRKWEIEGKNVHHIVNPLDPDNFDFDLKSVTVLGQTTEQADIWAKTLFIMGREKGVKYALENDIPAIFLRRDGSALVSKAAKEFLDNNN